MLLVCIEAITLGHLKDTTHLHETTVMIWIYQILIKVINIYLSIIIRWNVYRNIIMLKHVVSNIQEARNDVKTFCNAVQFSANQNAYTSAIWPCRLMEHRVQF